jgi:hypothetical protein
MITLKIGIAHPKCSRSIHSGRHPVWWRLFAEKSKPSLRY